MSSRYVEWLQQEGRALFKTGDLYWEIYNHALVPASVGPCFVDITITEAVRLLRDSRAWLLQCASHPDRMETEWWYVVCDSYDQMKLSSNTRSKVNRGLRHCMVRRLSPKWLADYGYDCYAAAFHRYKHAEPAREEQFKKNILRTIPGPFDYWGVFVGPSLAGYCQCIVENKDVATSIVKLDPRYLKYYTAYALLDAILTSYVAERGMIVNNGTRSIAHETDFQDFLLKFNFKKQFCRLNVFYTPLIKNAVYVFFPFRKLLSHLPDTMSLDRLSSLLFQEELRRLCHR
jgi:hypothetical protein